jgi:uncharacterized protein (TIRG00374 family)
VGLLRRPLATRAAVPVAAGLSSILLERALDLVALLLLGAGVGFALLRTQLPTWLSVVYSGGLLGLIVLTGALLVAPRLLTWLTDRWPHPWWQQVLRFAADVVHGLRALGSQPATAVLVLLESLYIWLCDALLMWLVLRALAVSAPLASIAFVALTVDIFAAIPITPGGIGQIEAVNVALLALLPLPPFNIAAAVLVNRAISYWSCLLVSGVVTFTTGIGQFIVPLTQEHIRGEAISEEATSGEKTSGEAR